MRPGATLAQSSQNKLRLSVGTGRSFTNTDLLRPGHLSANFEPGLLSGSDERRSPQCMSGGLGTENIVVG
jgi:hypothetical protein